MIVSRTDLSDVDSDLSHLYHLLDTICDTTFGENDPAVRARAEALLWIARDLSEKIGKDVAALFTGRAVQ